MNDESKQQSWWQTLPGILTATAGIITAVAGLVMALYQAGFFHGTKAERATIPVPIPASSSSISHPSPAPVAILQTGSSGSGSGIKGASGAEVRAEGVDANANSGIAAASKSSESLLSRTASPLTKPVNLLTTEKGGHLVAASSDDWLGTIDGKEGFNQISNGIMAEAVYVFKDEKPAMLEMFTLFIPGTEGNNVKEFELFVSNQSPTGPFESIGKFQTQNVKLFKTPYQEFKFVPVKATYLKIKLLSTYGGSPHPNVPEVQLFGKLDNS